MLFMLIIYASLQPMPPHTSCNVIYPARFPVGFTDSVNIDGHRRRSFTTDNVCFTPNQQMPFGRHLNVCPELVNSRFIYPLLYKERILYGVYYTLSTRCYLSNPNIKVKLKGHKGKLTYSCN